MLLAADALFLVTAAVYVAATAFFVRFLIGGAGGATVGARLIGAGAALHATQIVIGSLVLNVCPVEGIHFPMSVASMIMCVSYVFARRRYRVEVAGAIVAPLALTALLASRFVGGGAEPGARMRSAILPFHVAANLVGIGLFALAFSAAALYLVQERLLKAKRIDGVSRRLPPLDALDRAEHRFLVVCFPLLTLGMVTGTVWARKVEMGAPGAVLGALFGYVTWVVVAGVLFLRAAAGWRGRRAAYGTLAGFAFAVLVLAVYLLRPRSSPPVTAVLARPVAAEVAP